MMNTTLRLIVDSYDIPEYNPAASNLRPFQAHDHLNAYDNISWLVNDIKRSKTPVWYMAHQGEGELWCFDQENNEIRWYRLKKTFEHPFISKDEDGMQTFEVWECVGKEQFIPERIHSIILERVRQRAGSNPLPGTMQRIIETILTSLG